MQIHIMIDIETAGRKAGDAILSIGAVAFSPFREDEFDAFAGNIDLKDSVQAGFLMDPVTVQWWLKQPEAARSLMQESAHPADVTVRLFGEWLQRWKEASSEPLTFWAHGVDFERPIIEDYLETFEVPIPWTQRSWMDARTVARFMGIDYTQMEGYGSHGAIEDCRFQISVVKKSYELRGEL